jgi:fibronectin type 3 domain-containing protein
MSADQLNSLFKSYGDAGSHWTGGDSTTSVPLPDGRVAWLFSDTFLGTVNSDGSRPENSPMVNNTMVVQDGTALVSTKTGGTAGAPEALVKPTQAGEYFWVADGTVGNGSLKVLYNRHNRTGTGSLDFTLTGTSLATFTLPGLVVESVVDLPLGNSVAWGSALLEDGDYTYIYGSETSDSDLKFAKLARVPAGSLGGAWQFWTGSTWSANETDAGRLLSGVGTSYAMQKVGGQYVLLTQDSNLAFSPQYVAYTAPSPMGPFAEPIQLFRAPEQLPGSSIVTYDARTHPELASSGKLLVSYNVNSLNNADNFTDARIYRPRFVEVTWPLPTPDPAQLPAAPTNLSATSDSAGITTLSWQAAAGATGYHIYQKDVTASQTYFARLAASATDTSTQVDLLRTGHTYQFKVAAFNAAGEGPFSTTVSVTPTISAPSAPSGVTATADNQGGITVGWNRVDSAWHYEVFRRDVTAGEGSFSFAGQVAGSATSYHAEWLEQNHVYEFYLTAYHGGGTSPNSETVSATANYALPGAPSALTATAKSDGTIQLAWKAPGPDVWYLVYQRDVTVGETTFTQLALPVTEGTSLTAAFLTHAHTYEFKVTATNRGGEGPASNLARATSSYPIPQPPTALKATAGDGQVQLKWSPSPTPNVWYLVYQRDVTAGETTFSRLELPVTSCCEMTAGYLANGHTYEFKVTTTSQGGESSPSNLVQAKPQIPLPGQVTGLTASAQTDGTIKLSWTAPGENLWFDIHQRDVTAGQSTFTKLPLPVTSCCAYTASMLTHDHTYQFKVAATNAAGAGPQSAAVSAAAHYNPPAAPKNLRGESAGDGTIHLDWDPPSSGSFYYWVYYRDVTAGQASFTKGQYPTDRTEVDLAYLQYGHVYEYKVTASNPGGEGPLSTAIQVTATGGLPAAPTGLTASAGDGEVRLSWTASTTSGVTYNIYQRNASAGQSWQKLSLPVSGTSMTAGYLANGSTYEFKVTASNWAGSSSASNVASAKPMPPLPAPPSGLTASPGDGQVRLNWTASPSPNINYMVEVRPVGGAWDQLPVGVACCSYTVKLLRNGTTYEFRVRAHNILGDSNATSVASARPMPPSPEPASALSATAGDGMVTLSWSASPTSGASYWIELRTEGGNWQKLPYAVGCCTFPVKLLNNGTTYYFRVLATNLAGTAAATNTASARPLPPKPAAPTNLQATAGNHQVTLNWTPSTTPNVLYWVWMRDGPGSWTRFSLPVSVTSAVLQLRAGRIYSFKVQANNLAGNSDFSNIATATPWQSASPDPTTDPDYRRESSEYFSVEAGPIDTYACTGWAWVGQTWNGYIEASTRVTCPGEHLGYTVRARIAVTKIGDSSIATHTTECGSGHSCSSSVSTSGSNGRTYCNQAYAATLSRGFTREGFGYPCITT